MRPALNRKRWPLGYCSHCGLVKYVGPDSWACKCSRRVRVQHLPVPTEYINAAQVYVGPSHIPEWQRPAMALERFPQR